LSDHTPCWLVWQTYYDQRSNFHACLRAIITTSESDAKRYADAARNEQDGRNWIVNMKVHIEPRLINHMYGLKDFSIADGLYQAEIKGEL